MTPMAQGYVISLVTNGASALALLVIAFLVVRSRVLRPDVVCPFYAYPMATSISLLAITYSVRATAVWTRVGLISLVIDSLTAMSLVICAIYVRELLADIREMPNPHHQKAANAELARAVTQLTEGEGQQ